MNTANTLFGIHFIAFGDGNTTEILVHRNKFPVLDVNRFVIRVDYLNLQYLSTKNSPCTRSWFCEQSPRRTS